MPVSPTNRYAHPWEFICVNTMYTATILFLTLERLKGDESFWKPYLDILPARYDTTARWTEAELELFRDPYIKAKSLERLREIEKDYLALMQALEGTGYDEELNFDVFEWAWNTAATRCFFLPEVTECAMVPFADLLNHHSDSAVTWTVSEDGVFEMILGGSAPVQKGDQVYNNYASDDS